MQIVAHAATPIRGTTPLKKPNAPDVAIIRFAAATIVGFDEIFSAEANDCISTRSTYILSISCID
jgi:hypothetical protein